MSVQGSIADLKFDRAVVETDGYGRATWVFSSPFERPPVMMATPVDSGTADKYFYGVAIESVTSTQAVVRLWHTQRVTPFDSAAGTEAATGIPVHLMAVAS